MKTHLPINYAGAVTSALLGFIAVLPVPAAVLRVPADYATIQAAVNAAQSGDEVHIAAGAYQQQVIITNKTLTVTGEPGTVLQSWSGMTLSYRFVPAGFPFAALIEIASADVTLRWIEFDGERLAETIPPLHSYSSFHGALYIAAAGRVENCVFRGFRGATSGVGWGLVAVNPPAPGSKVVTMSVLHNTFADNGTSMAFGGLQPNHPDIVALSMNIDLEDNVISGNGPTAFTSTDFGDHAQTAIQIYPDAGGTIKNNQITGHIYTGSAAGLHAFGILAFDEDNFDASKPISALQPLLIEGNTFVNCERGITVARGDNCKCLGNVFQRTSEGPSGDGVCVSGANVTVSFNTFTTLSRGIVLFGDDPEYGTSTGILHGAALMDNRFCSVGSNVVAEPLVTGVTEHGSLNCPFPAPALDIAQAVFLSWPNYAAGWALESAPNVNGPWTPLDAVPTVQDGRYTFVVPSDSHRLLFRLRAP